MSSLLEACAELEKKQYRPRPAKDNPSTNSKAKKLSFTDKIITPADRQYAADMLSIHYTGRQGTFPVDFLPETGVSVESGGRIICIIPIYLEQSSTVAVLGHFIAGNATPKQIHQAAHIAIQAAERFAKAAGKKYLISLFGRRSINRIADTLGFITADKVEEKILHLK